VLREIVPPNTGLAFAAMRELRTHLTSLEDFVEQIDGVQRPTGYRLVGVLPDDGTDAVAVAGFRLSTSLSWGRHVYIDDLSTMSSARRRGFAGELLG
jgi:ribosomal protein S18 acetylase RimI-like enzyme